MSWKGCSLVTLGNLPGDRTQQVNTIGLLGRWSWKGNYFMTLGKALLCTFIVHVFQKTDLLEWVCCPCKDWFWTICTLGWCGGIERINFLLFPHWKCVVILKGLITNNIKFGRMWWSCKDWFWIICTLGWCVVLKGLILDNWGGCSYPEITYFR